MCAQHRKGILSKSKALCDKGYAEEITLACGTPSVELIFRRLTKPGLAVLLEAPDDAVINGTIRIDHFRSGSAQSIELREWLIESAGVESKLDQQVFDDTISDTVASGHITPLTYAIDQVSNVNFGKKYSQSQKYNMWRLSHINAMFVANNHLTYIDKRPYDTGFSIDGIVDEESYAAYTKKYGHTVASMTYYALTHWYQNNPGYYRLVQQTPDISNKAKENWLNTPAFYSTRELPTSNQHNLVSLGTNAKGSQRKSYGIYIGLAMGKKVNYICYHAKPGVFQWVLTRERAAKQAAEIAIRQMKSKHPEMRCRDTVDYALYFCSSHHQFLALFASIKAKHTPRKKRAHPCKQPYIDMYCIPVNDSGTHLLGCLLDYSPVDAEYRIHEELVAMDIGFAHTAQYIYPLTYKGRPVLSGYTMNIKRISHVLQDYLDGHMITICCYPEQAPWYRLLFPGCTIL